MMTTQAAQGTGPAVSSFTPRHAAPSLRRAVQRWDSRPSHPCSKFSHHHSNYPSPHDPPSPTSRGQAPHLPSSVSIPLRPALTVGDWARPSWLLRCRPSPPLLLHAPASQSQPPSGLARSRSCACAARSARGPLRQPAPAHLAPGASFSVPDGRLLWVSGGNCNRLALGT